MPKQDHDSKSSRSGCTQAGCLILALMFVVILMLNAFSGKRPSSRESESPLPKSHGAPISAEDVHTTDSPHADLPPLEPENPPHGKPSAAESPSQAVSLPAFKIVREEPYDAPIKTQIEYRVVLLESTDEARLRLLLGHLLEAGQAKRGFKYHGGKATHVFAYVYPSDEHSGAQWLGMVSQIGKDATPSFDVKSELIGKAPAQEGKFGLSVAERKEVFRQAFLTDDESMKRAEAAVPLPIGRVEPAKAREVFTKQAEEQERIRVELRAPILKKYGIDDETFRQIVVEGFKENWPQPSDTGG